jgi:hypothetical protein
MNDQPKTSPSTWERSTVVRSGRWLCSGRGIRRVLIVLAWCATVIGLWYGEENWRGRRAWNQYREATEARGESLDFATYIPKPMPDDQNFAATPFLTSFILRRNEPILKPRTSRTKAAGSFRTWWRGKWLPPPFKTAR